MIDSNIPCDSRKLVVDEAKESLASPSFHDRFRKLKWIRYFSIRDELSTREINFTFSSPSLPASFSIRPSPIQIVWSASDRSNRVTKFRKLELRTRGTDSNYLSDWNIQNADNPSPPPAPRCCLDASTNSRRRSGGKRRGKGRFDRILNEGSKGFIFVKKKKKAIGRVAWGGEGQRRVYIQRKGEVLKRRDLRNLSWTRGTYISDSTRVF